jgi:hypothetical protein
MTPKPIKRLTLDLNRVGGLEPEILPVVSRTFRKAHLWRNSHLFTVAEKERETRLTQGDGVYSIGGDVFAYTKDEVGYHSETGCDFDLHLSSHAPAVVLVWRRSHLQPADLDHQYEFKNPKRQRDALVAVADVLQDTAPTSRFDRDVAATEGMKPYDPFLDSDHPILQLDDKPYFF